MTSKYFPIRRSTRLPLEVPVQIASSDGKFCEQCTTSVVSAHGCGIAASRPLPLGTPVTITLSGSGKSATAKVAVAVELSRQEGTWLLGLELDSPRNFWEVPYPPADWQVGPAYARQNAAKSGELADAQLVATSVGACYVRAASTFPIHSVVLVKVTGKAAVHSFRGKVQVEHSGAGMGIEFLGRGLPHRKSMERLVEDLADQGTAPRVQIELNASRDAIAPSPPDPHDHLLALVLVGRTLKKDDFLYELEKQRRTREPQQRAASSPA
jgi:hypothetical protein